MDAADKNDDAQPILVQFEHGTLKYGLKENVTFKYLRSKVPSSKKRMLVAETENHSYVGMVTKKQQSLLRYYIGIVDEKTNRIEQMAPCRHCTLKPKLKQYVDMKDPSETAQEKSFKQKTDTLVEAFGTAKQKRLVASRKKNEDVHSTISDKVSEVAKKIIAKTPASTPQTPDEAADEGGDVIPPLNKEATSVDNMYHVDDIISFQEYSSLKKLSQEMADSDNDTLMTWKKENKYPEFVLHHLCALPSHTGRREELLCYLFYINQLMYLFLLPPRRIPREKKEKIPEEIRQTLFDKFTTLDDSNKSGRFMPKKYKDKVLAHILVLALIVEHYELNCNLLLKDLKLSVNRITTLLREIGCTVKTTGKRKRGAIETALPAEIQVHASLHLPKSAIPKPPKNEKKSKMKTESDSTGATPPKPTPKGPSTPSKPTPKGSSMPSKPTPKGPSTPSKPTSKGPATASKNIPIGPSTPKKRKIKTEPED